MRVRRKNINGESIRGLIGLVREQLELATRDMVASGRDPMFRVGEIVLDLKFGLARTAKGGAKANIVVASLGGEVGQTAQQTHSIRIRLDPLELPETEEPPLGILQAREKKSSLRRAKP